MGLNRRIYKPNYKTKYGEYYKRIGKFSIRSLNLKQGEVWRN